MPIPSTAGRLTSSRHRTWPLRSSVTDSVCVRRGACWRRTVCGPQAVATRRPTQRSGQAHRAPHRRAAAARRARPERDALASRSGCQCGTARNRASADRPPSALRRAAPAHRWWPLHPGALGSHHRPLLPSPIVARPGVHLRPPGHLIPTLHRRQERYVAPCWHLRERGTAMPGPAPKPARPAGCRTFLAGCSATGSNDRWLRMAVPDADEHWPSRCSIFAGQRSPLGGSGSPCGPG